MFPVKSVLFLLLAVGVAAQQECRLLVFDHVYESPNADGSTNFIRHTNLFPPTPINDFGLTRDLCVESNGLPVVRRCLASGQWEPFGNISCRSSLASDERSRRLNDMQNTLNDIVEVRTLKQPDPEHILQSINSLIDPGQYAVQPFDVVAVNNIVNRLVKERPNVKIGAEMTGLYNNLMATSRAVLELCASLNATNDLLYKFEDYTNGLAQQVESCHTPLANPEQVNVQVRNGVQVLLGRNLSVFYLFPKCNGYTGIAIYAQAGEQRESCSHHGFWYRLLNADEDVDALQAEPDLIAATYLDEVLWTQLRRSGVTYLVLKVYAHSALFVDQSPGTARAAPSSPVLSISIPQAATHLARPLVILLRNEHYSPAYRYRKQLDSYCGYWNYGSWRTEDVMTSWESLYDGPIVRCYTRHLTQFSFLVGVSCQQHRCFYDLDQDLRDWMESLLDKASVAGCGLSTFGLLGIWVTAAVSAKWRSSLSKKLLLNVCAATTLFFGLLLFTYINEWTELYSFSEHRTACIALGSVLHYAVMLQFTWMLTIGLLQYRRYVTVLTGQLLPRLRMIALVAWTLPLLPTLALLFVDRTSYAPIMTGSFGSSCYPAGQGLVFAVLAPIGIVLLANMLIFGCIFYSVNRLMDRNWRMVWLKMRLCVLLFFLLGMSWLFGIGAYLGMGFLFTFVFCLLATVQGFVLFLFYVAFDKDAQSAWKDMFRSRPSTEEIDLR